ncbi:MAG TPA: NAD(P)H-hydrate dehydratase, partial [Firmicutes bacterium]|nr:NAD(P)H-hydrate dehydratase [Bacillota bacterium]
LAGLSNEEVVRNPLDLAREKASRWRAVTVLKGAPTVVALPGGKAYINTTGNDGMATGGSGDILTGLVAGLIAQGAAPEAAAPAAVYIHGLAGDLAAREQGKRGMIASDILHHIPRAMEIIIKGDKQESSFQPDCVRLRLNPC